MLVYPKKIRYDLATKSKRGGRSIGPWVKLEGVQLSEGRDDFVDLSLPLGWSFLTALMFPPPYSLLNLQLFAVSLAKRNSTIFVFGGERILLQELHSGPVIRDSADESSGQSTVKALNLAVFGMAMRQVGVLEPTVKVKVKVEVLAWLLPFQAIEFHHVQFHTLL